MRPGSFKVQAFRTEQLVNRVYVYLLHSVLHGRSNEHRCDAVNSMLSYSLEQILEDRLTVVAEA